MPPHCDTMDGPVVRAAIRALTTRNVNLALPWVHEPEEEELRDAFERTVLARATGGVAAEVADQWFFETIVRLHRRGEGAPFEGVKPAGLDHGPVLEPAERALETGDLTDVEEALLLAMEEGLRGRLETARATRRHAVNDVAAARRHVNAVLDFELYAHHAYKALAARGGHGAKADANSEELAVAHAR